MMTIWERMMRTKKRTRKQNEDKKMNHTGDEEGESERESDGRRRSEKLKLKKSKRKWKRKEMQKGHEEEQEEHKGTGARNPQQKERDRQKEIGIRNTNVWNRKEAGWEARNAMHVMADKERGKQNAQRPCSTYQSNLFQDQHTLLQHLKGTKYPPVPQLLSIHKSLIHPGRNGDQ